MAKKYITLLLAFAGSLFFSCNKTSNTPSPEILMRAEVNNLPWISYEVAASIEKTNYVNLNIVGDSSGSRISMHIADYRGVGTYELPLNGNTATFIGRASVYPHVATSGRITITENIPVSSSLTQITGTFEFLADVVPVQTGSFKVKISLD